MAVEQKGAGVRLVSANLYRGRVPPRYLAGLLGELAPDVGAFQELTPAMGEVVGAHFAHGVLHPGAGAAGLGIGARCPIMAGVLNLPRRPATVATLDPATWPGLARPMRLVNVHLTHPMVFPLWRALPARSRQLTTVIDHVADHDAMVVGDLNVPPGWPAYRRLRRSMDDAAYLAAVAAGTRPQPTWSLRPQGRGLLRIDHVMVRGVDVRDVFTVPLAGSDHRLIVVDVADEV